MRKKLTPLLLIVCMALTISACNATEETSRKIKWGDNESTESGSIVDRADIEEQQEYLEFEETDESQSDHIHNYSEATCTLPKKCSCGETIGLALGHNYSEATCTSPEICTECGETNGDALGHDYIAATCTSPKICERCDIVDGSKLGHNFKNAKCTRCGKLDRTYLIEDIDYLRCSEHLRYTEESITDNDGKVFSEHLSFYGYAFNYDPSISFSLKGKYSKFNATVLLPYEDRGSDVSSCIKIYGDDKLLYQLEDIKMGFETTDIEVNVKGVSVLEIEIIPYLGMNYDTVPHITNAYLEK